ncbi:GPR endopeptidase [Hazenella sp. IB182357]|uniref:Germination protease n=1 Tax=Polycladospora coralii TaxID=2771432 RepID=A0A926N4W3_9BACL|nr:GPR endopeptidase [Polycladospora coralii]MBD1371134.1 GPR endopeptidase [Polycladospora coralii]MBS7530076.1 GPR endopeptidase [Polycladospora coralii]
MNEHQIDLSQYAVRTDLAREGHEMATQRRGEDSPIPGVYIEENTQDGITTSWIRIENQEGAAEIGKVPGLYFTLEVPGLRSGDSGLEQRVSQHFAEQFHHFMDEVGIAPNATCLVVGLGNVNVTADALGPMVVRHTMVTRHLFELAPDQVSDGYRSVCGVAPGVLGTTGIETSEIVRGIIEKAKPDFVIAFDSLASRALSRVNTTIQVADTGIHPGSGVGNNRQALNKESLGIPVIAVGIPTVVDAVTIAHNVIDFVMAHLSREIEGIKNNPLDPYNRPSIQELELHEPSPESKSKMLGMYGELEQNEKRQLIHEVLQPLGQNLIVTPKEVDSFIANMAKTVANGLNCALHEAVTMDNVASHTS